MSILTRTYSTIPQPKPRLSPVAVWLLGLAGAAVAAVTIVLPKWGALILIAAALLIAIGRIVTRPLRGLLLALGFFPFFQIVRAALVVYVPAAPVSGIRFWAEVLLLATLAGIVVRCIVRRKRLTLTWNDTPVVLLLASAGYGLVLTLNDRAYVLAVFGIYFSLTSVLFYFAARWIDPSAEDLRRIVRVVLVGYALLALGSLIEYAFHPPILMRIIVESRPAFFKGVTDPVEWVTSTYVRMQSLLLDENFWGALSSFVSLYCLANLSRRRPGVAVSLLGLLATACLFLSMSRGALAGWLVGLFILLLLRGRHRTRIALSAVALIAVAAIVLVNIQVRMDRVTIFLQRLQTAGITRQGLHPDRAASWENAVQIFQMLPSGMGLGTAGYSAMYTGLRAPTVTDGYYLRVAVEQGIVGLVVLAAGMIGLQIVLCRLLPREEGDERVLGMTLIGSLAALCVHSTVANTFDYYYVPTLFYLMTGLYVARRCRRPASPDAP